MTSGPIAPKPPTLASPCPDDRSPRVRPSCPPHRGDGPVRDDHTSAAPCAPLPRCRPSRAISHEVGWFWTRWAVSRRPALDRPGPLAPSRQGDRYGPKPARAPVHVAAMVTHSPGRTVRRDDAPNGLRACCNGSLVWDHLLHDERSARLGSGVATTSARQTEVLSGAFGNDGDPCDPGAVDARQAHPTANHPPLSSRAEERGWVGRTAPRAPTKRVSRCGRAG